jgi:hypothetical protein
MTKRNIKNQPEPETRDIGIKVADEVWLATALLHREQPERDGFSISEIVERAERERFTQRLRPGVRVHVTLHCVADLPPNPGRYCMLRALPGNRRRLHRGGDPVHPDRAGAKTRPAREEIPESYRSLLDWFEREYEGHGAALESPTLDPLLALRGSGRQLWADEPPDSYVERLRSGWS